MSWFDQLKQWSKGVHQDPCYLMMTVRSPYSLASIREVSLPKTLVSTLNHKQLGGPKIAAINVSDLQTFKFFPLVGLMTSKNKVDELRKLPFVEYVYEAEQYAWPESYLKLVTSLEAVIENGEHVVSMSLQPLRPYPFEEKEAFNVATRIVHDKGVVLVLAAGNFGEDGDNTLSPWSIAPWVIGVGAAYADGKRLWENSSIGIAGDARYHPTVVAPGVDIVAAGKTLSGTSPATAHVSGIVARCREFITYVYQSPMFYELFETVEGKQDGSMQPVSNVADVIKNMIVDMAVEMPGYGVHEVGAGFVDNDIATNYFENFGLSNVIKVFTTAAGGKQDALSQY